MGWDTYICIEELVKDDQGNEKYVCINKNQEDFWAFKGTIDKLFNNEFLKDPYYTDPIDMDHDYPNYPKNFAEIVNIGDAISGVIYLSNNIRISYASYF